MIGFDGGGGHDACAVGFELCAGERDQFGRVVEAVGGAMDGDEAFAGCDEIEDGFFVFGLDGGDVGVDEEGVEKVEVGGGELVVVFGVEDIDTAFGEDGDELFGAVGGSMVAAVAEEEDFDATWLVCLDGLRVGEEGECGDGKQAAEDERDGGFEFK